MVVGWHVQEGEGPVSKCSCAVWNVGPHLSCVGVLRGHARRRHAQHGGAGGSSDTGGEEGAAGERVKRRSNARIT